MEPPHQFFLGRRFEKIVAGGHYLMGPFHYLRRHIAAGKQLQIYHVYKAALGNGKV